MKINGKSYTLEDNLGVVLCGCENLSIFTREKYILRVFSTGSLHKISFQSDIYLQIHLPCFCLRKHRSWEQNLSTGATL